VSYNGAAPGDTEFKSNFAYNCLEPDGSRLWLPDVPKGSDLTWQLHQVEFGGNSSLFDAGNPLWGLTEEKLFGFFLSLMEKSREAESYFCGIEL
jgi:hypothetical protein